MTRSKLNQEQTIDLVKKHIMPIDDHQLRQDLWPRMLRRLDRKTNPISLLDWGLLTAAIAIVMVWPQSITGLFYQL